MTDYEKALIVWPGIGEREIISVGPLGSRPTHNYLVFNRRTHEVFTGWNLNPAPGGCFSGPLDEFEQSVEIEYAKKLQIGFNIRWWAEYKVAIAFLRSLPPLEEKR